MIVTSTLLCLTEEQQRSIQALASNLRAGWFGDLMTHMQLTLLDGYVSIGTDQLNRDKITLKYTEGVSSLEIVSEPKRWELRAHHDGADAMVILEPVVTSTFETEPVLEWTLKAVQLLTPAASKSQEFLILEVLFAALRRNGKKAFTTQGSGNVFSFDGDHTVSYVGKKDGFGHQHIWVYVEHADHFELIGNVYGDEIRTTKVEVDGIYFHDSEQRRHRSDLINTKEMHPAEEALRHICRRF